MNVHLAVDPDPSVDLSVDPDWPVDLAGQRYYCDHRQQ